ncbi:MAG: DUF2835 domain-containing protein [Desulfuromonadaceae bacterium]|nr:DUF2835 domain-containing protein [Desulfuromonas sp.]MDY0186136.1 DUF2835 domain-containing protein [Desulfuromonadaceae bacterium]
MAVITFHLDISTTDFLRYYQGQASSVSVIADDGRRLRLPAIRFRPFLERTGVHGRFRLEFDANNKFISLTRI